MFWIEKLFSEKGLIIDFDIESGKKVDVILVELVLIMVFKDIELLNI